MIEISQELANDLFKRFAFLIILDVPKNLEFGIDLNAFDIGPKFMGIKLIPPGLHLIYYSLQDPTCSSGGGIGDRLGFWHNFSEKEIIVRKWSKDSESLITVDNEIIQRLSLIENLYNLDKNLGVFPMGTINEWRYLTSHITSELIIRIFGKEMLCSTSMEGEGYLKDEDFKLKISEIQTVEEEKSTKSRFLNYTLIDINKSWSSNAISQERSRDYLDKTNLLMRILDQIGDQNLLGEFEISFIQLILLNSYSSFIQWKTIMELICRSERALKNEENIQNIFLPFLDTFLHQLNVIPDSFLTPDISESFISNCIRLLSTHTRELKEDNSTFNIMNLDYLMEKIDQVIRTFHDQFGWKISIDDELENEEDQPVVVDL